MYFSTLTEIPILQALIAKGMSNGPALALLLAGPRLSLPNMLVVRWVLGTKKTFVCVTLVVIYSTIAGLIFGSYNKKKQNSRIYIDANNVNYLMQKIGDNMGEDYYKNFVLAIFILVSFVLLVTFISFYIKNTASNSCFCGLPLWLSVILISLLGLFIGSFIYYTLNKHYIKEKHKSEKAIVKTLSFLEGDEKKVIIIILKLSGEITQRKLCELTGFDKVRISRILSKLEKKDLVRREKYGMTNKIVLDGDLSELFKEIDVSKFETNI